MPKKVLLAPPENIMVQAENLVKIYKSRDVEVMAEQTMSLERAMENAIVSTEMEGFVVTREQRELMVRVLKKEITLEEAISMLSKKYK